MDCYGHIVTATDLKLIGSWKNVSMNSSLLKRNCPKCNMVILYSNRSNYNRGNNSNSTCYSCANDTRKGRKRTLEQCKLISEKTKQAMADETVRSKIKSGMNTPENKLLRSNSTKNQVCLLKQDSNKFQKFVDKQIINKKQYWSSIDSATKQYLLNHLKLGREKFVNSSEYDSYKQELSRRFTGKNNPFSGKKHSEETVEKLRKLSTERILRFWNDGGLHGINTKPELLVQDILKKNNIEFITPFVLKNKIYDLYLPKYNLLIEVDGCYWHSKGILPDNMNTQQLRRWKNDKFKENLAFKNNFKLIRIWEDEINEETVMKGII